MTNNYKKYDKSDDDIVNYFTKDAKEVYYYACAGEDLGNNKFFMAENMIKAMHYFVNRVPVEQRKEIPILYDYYNDIDFQKCDKDKKIYFDIALDIHCLLQLNDTNKNEFNKLHEFIDQHKNNNEHQKYMEKRYNGFMKFASASANSDKCLIL